MKDQSRFPDKGYFLSYSHADRAFAHHISKLLRQRGLAVIDWESAIEHGADSQDTIFRDLENARSMIFIVPAREGDGKNALAELGAARALGKHIVAVMPDSSRASNAGFARRLTDSAVIDASTMREDALIDALALAS
ncbi:TIR domain-containing protein [Hoeflea marina]|uniref:TIR domain-containing protein n=1 Tax=Hoeflea marina TaxID=274592 RepID=A0A317PD85_9HYPH|nr:toll/interleukin-1 receptor domain-containing protein [Hoeflea marina]PWV97230.1 TIR domain-containing protein [Hoeflea marina]